MNIIFFMKSNFKETREEINHLLIDQLTEQTIFTKRNNRSQLRILFLQLSAQFPSNKDIFKKKKIKIN